MPDKPNGPQVYDTPVHGSREDSVREVNARLTENPPSDEPLPEMRHEVEGTAIVVEESSGAAAAEASGRVLTNREASDGKNTGAGANSVTP